MCVIFNLSIEIVHYRRKSAAGSGYYGEQNGKGNAYKQPNKLCAAVIALVFVYIAAKAPYKREYEADEGNARQKVKPEELADLQRSGIAVSGRGLINRLLWLILRLGLRLGFGCGSLLSFACKERAAGGAELGRFGNVISAFGAEHMHYLLIRLQTVYHICFNMRSKNYGHGQVLWIIMTHIDAFINGLNDFVL